MQRKIPIRTVHTKKRRLYVVCNWKMQPKTLKEARVLISRVYVESKKNPHVVSIVCPPAVFLPIFSLRGKGVAFGLQDMHTEVVGPHTGCISGAQAASVGVTYVIIGHAEVRARGDTPGTIAHKVFNALSVGLTPILCIGEKERDMQGVYLQTLRADITSCMSLLPLHMRSKLVIAYEPLYAIGADHPPATDEIHQTLLSIRKILLEEYGGSVARVVPLLYGGAVTGSSARDIIMRVPECAGFLVGRASVDKDALGELYRML
jgi:triosephosphate isomerase (TIM)